VGAHLGPDATKEALKATKGSTDLRRVKVSPDQVRSSLAALEAEVPVSGGVGVTVRYPVVVPDGVSERIAAAPLIRVDAVANAKAWLCKGETPTADELARAVLGRLISDRLR
jgi:hypothetical protein